MRTLFLFIILAVAVFLAGCSTTEKIDDEELLYVGIKSTNYQRPPSESWTADTARLMDARALQAERKREETAFQTVKAEVDAALAYAPNGSIFGSSSLTQPFKLRLRIYNRFADSKSRFGRWMFRHFSEAPVLVSTVAPDTRVKVAENTLHNYGFFRGRVSYSIVKGKRPKTARIAYDISTGPLFALDSVEYRSFGFEQDSLLRQHAAQSLLHGGDAFSVINLSGEQERMGNLLRENGYYYWSPAYTTFQADTLMRRGSVQLRVLPKAGVESAAQRPWYIGDTYINIRDARAMAADSAAKFNTLCSRRGTTYTWMGKDIPLKPRLWRSAIMHRKGERYSLTDQQATVSKLSALGIFSGLDVNYIPRDTTASCDTLDLYINTVMSKPYDSSFEVNATLKSNQQIGPGVKYELAKRNAFRGGETVSWNIFGSYEWQFGRHRNGGNSMLNSFEVGSSLNFELPRFAFPFVSKRRLRFPATTHFTIESNLKNRSGFFRILDLGGSVVYNWQPRSRAHAAGRGSMRHEWTLLDLSYYKLLSTTAAFDSISEANPALYATMRNVFVPSMSYSFTYASPTADPHPLWLQGTVKEAGNLTDGLHCLFFPHHDSATPRRILSSRFAQFVKATAEVHYTRTLSPRFKLASRAFAGVIFNYGGNESAPYAEQFYIGGANSVRAFTVRTAGPGSYRSPNSKYAYIDQTGDFKLEANVELRAKIFGGLHGAAFLDAGNIWLMKRDALRPGAELSARNLRHIALGTGAGVRYDLDFLVLRFDVGIGLHAPYSTSRSGFYNFERFRDGVAYHFAIGYPF